MPINCKIILEKKQFSIVIDRLCYELIEKHGLFENTAIIGLQPRGIYLARRVLKRLNEITLNDSITYGELDISFYRDDFRRREIGNPSTTEISFQIENKKVILIDDVLFTGRTIRAGMDALLDIGRPEKIELLTLVDRRYSRHLPIAPDYFGIQVDTISTEKVKVEWKELDGQDAVWIY